MKTPDWKYTDDVASIIIVSGGAIIAVLASVTVALLTISGTITPSQAAVDAAVGSLVQLGQVAVLGALAHLYGKRVIRGLIDLEPRKRKEG